MFIDKVVSLVFGLIFLFVLSCDGPSAESVVQEREAAAGKSKSLQNDPVFWDYAVSSNMLQTELAKLASEKVSSDSMKAMSEKTIHFHGKALQQVQLLVTDEVKVKLPDSLGSADRALVQEFKLLEGEEFNSRYRDFIFNSHRMQLERYREALERSENQQTRDWLQEMLAHLRKELDVVATSDAIVQQ